MIKSTQKIEEIKKIATDNDLILYSYVVDKANNIVDKLVNKIKKSALDEGKLIFISGPMNSGKSIIACRLIEQLKEKVTNRLSVNAQPGVDRSDILPGEIFSRFGITCPAQSFSTKQEIESIFHKNDVVIVDEIQFTPYELQSFFLKEAEQFVERGGWFVAIGLRYTALQGEFIFPALIYERADEKFLLNATCQMCGRRRATRNQRLINGKAALYKDEDLVNPTTQVSYEPRCQECLII